jgi:hypothetical protein
MPLTKPRTLVTMEKEEKEKNNSVIEKRYYHAEHI